MAEQARGMQKLKIYRDYEIDESGVTSVWAWLCPEASCHKRTSGHGAALYWENAQKMANRHLKMWHR